MNNWLFILYHGFENLSQQIMTVHKVHMISKSSEVDVDWSIFNKLYLVRFARVSCVDWRRPHRQSIALIDVKLCFLIPLFRWYSFERDIYKNKIIIFLIPQKVEFVRYRNPSHRYWSTRRTLTLYTYFETQCVLLWLPEIQIHFIKIRD